MREDTFVYFENKQEILNSFKKKRVKLANIAEEYRDDEEIVLAFLKRDGTDIKHASKRLRADKKFMKRAIQLMPRAIMYAAEEIRNDSAMRALAYRQEGAFIVDPEAFKEFEKLDREICSYTTPTKTMSYAGGEQTLLATKDEYDAFDKFLELGRLVASKKTSTAHKLLYTKEFLTYLGKDPRFSYGYTVADVKKLATVYKDYKKLEKLYIASSQNPITYEDIEEIEKFLLEKAESKDVNTQQKHFRIGY